MVIDITGPRVSDISTGNVYLPGKDQLGQRAKSFACTCLDGLVLDPANVAACISPDDNAKGVQVIHPEAGLVYLNQDSTKQPVDPANYPQAEWEARETKSDEKVTYEDAVAITAAEAKENKPKKEEEKVAITAAAAETEPKNVEDLKKQLEEVQSRSKQLAEGETAARKTAKKEAEEAAKAARKEAAAEEKAEVVAAFSNPVNSEKVAAAVAEIHEEPAPEGIAWKLKAQSEEPQEQSKAQPSVLVAAAGASLMLMAALVVVRRRLIAARASSTGGQWAVTRTATADLGGGVAPGTDCLAVI
jgi:hypothetical protein